MNRLTTSKSLINKSMPIWLAMVTLTAFSLNAKPPSEYTTKRVSLYKKFLFGTPIHPRYAGFRVDMRGPYCTTQTMKKVYKDALYTKDLIHEMGFNSIQPFCPCDAGMTALGASDKTMAYFKKKKQSTTQEFGEFLAGLKDTPIILAYADMAKMRFPFFLLIKEKIWKKESMIKPAPGVHIGFLPMRPDSEQGWKFLSAIYTATAKEAVKHNANVLAYQLLNEIDYSDTGMNTRKAFKAFLEEKYGSVANAAAHYGIEKFDPLSMKLLPKRGTPMRTIWGEFLEDFFAKQVKRIVQLIKSIDKRKDVRFSVECNSAGLFKENSSTNYWRLIKDGGITLINGEYMLPWFGSYKGIKVDEGDAGVFQGSIGPLLTTEILKGAGEGKLPAIDTEQSLKRYLNGAIVPVRPGDMVTRLWQNFFRGISGAYLYSWMKFYQTWGPKPWTYESARFAAVKYKYAGASLLNPYSFPGETLSAIKTFGNEINRCEKYIPHDNGYGTPRIYLLYSSSTRRQMFDDYVFQERLLSPVRAFEHSQLPWAVIWEESIEEKHIPPNAEIIVATAASNLSEKAFKNLKSWVKNGGTLISSAGSLALNKYSKKRNDGFLFKVKSNLNLKNVKLPGEKTCFKKIVASAAPFVSRSDATKKKAMHKNTVLIAMKKYGRGRYYSIPEFKSGNTAPLDSFLVWTIKNTGYRTVWNAEDLSGNPVKELEAIGIGKADKLFLYLTLWGPKPKLVNLKLDLPDGDYLVSEARKQEQFLSEKNSKVWTSSEIKKGIQIALPSQEARVLLIQNAANRIPWKTVAVTRSGQKKKLALFTKLEHNYIQKERMQVKKINEMYEVKGKIIESYDIIKNGKPAIKVKFNKLKLGKNNNSDAILMPLPIDAKWFYHGSIKPKTDISLKKSYAKKGWIVLEVNSLAPDGVIPKFAFRMKAYTAKGKCYWDFSPFSLDADANTWQTAAIKLSDYKRVDGSNIRKGDLAEALAGIHLLVPQFTYVLKNGIAIRNLRFVVTE